MIFFSLSRCSRLRINHVAAKCEADLQQCNSDEDPGHQGEVVLQPLLKLRHAALHVDVVLLLRVLHKHHRLGHYLHFLTF